MSSYSTAELTALFADAVGELRPAAFQRSIFDRMGLDPADCGKTETAVRKIGDDINTAWIERFNAVERAGGAS